MDAESMTAMLTDMGFLLDDITRVLAKTLDMDTALTMLTTGGMVVHVFILSITTSTIRYPCRCRAIVITLPRVAHNYQNQKAERGFRRYH
jgi:hypothetical protein